MKRTTLLLTFMMMFAIPCVINAQKVNLSGTTWKWDGTDFLADVGTMGKSEDLIFGDGNQVSIVSVEWVMVLKEGSVRELVDEETGEVRIVKGMPLRTSQPIETIKKGTYALKKVKVDKKKQYCVHVEVEGQTADYKIQGDSLISLENTEEGKVYKKK